MATNSSYPVLLNPDTERLILKYNKISGPCFCLLNVIVFFLIIFDPDNRHTKYRRYLLCLQFICSGTDLLLSLISPVLLAKFWVVYSTGIMPFGISVKMAILTYVFLIIEIVIAYAACVFYCHQAIIPTDSPFRLDRWFHPFIAVLNAWLLIFLPCVYYAISVLEYTEDAIPFELRWITTKKDYYVFHWDEDSVWILIGGGILFSAPVYLTALIVFCHMFIIIRTGMGHVSPAMRKTQIRAAVSIALQITIPSFTLIGPLGYQLGHLLLRFDVMSVEFLACQFSMSNGHAMLNSLTILLRSKYYMKMLTFPVLYCIHHTVRTVRDVIDPHSSSVAPSQDLATPAVSAHYDVSPQSHQDTTGQATTSNQAARMYPSSEVSVQSLQPRDTSQIQPGVAPTEESLHSR